MDCAVVKRETLARVESESVEEFINPNVRQSGSHVAIAGEVKVTCYCHGRTYVVNRYDVVTGASRQLYSTESFDADTFAAMSPNCDVLVEVRRGRSGDYAVFTFRNRPGFSKSENDPFKITVSRHQKVIEFASKPTQIISFGEMAH